MVSLADHIDIATGGEYIHFDHLVKMEEVLERAAKGEVTNIMIFMPPRHGKSLTVKGLASYLMRRFKGRSVIYACHTDSLSVEMSKEVQSMHLASGGKFKGGRLKADVKSWQSETGGTFTAVGTGSALTGKGGDVLILDDPIKDAEEAQSPVVQGGKLAWYSSTFKTRKNPAIGRKRKYPTVTIIVMTLWSPADIPMQIMQAEKILASNEDTKHLCTNWTVLYFPGIKEAEKLDIPDHFTVIPDDRQIGEALCPDIATVEDLEKIRAENMAIGQSWVWESLYQQRPIPADGVYVKQDWIRVVPRDRIPSLVRWFRGWDLAFTADGGDRTVSALCGIDNDRNIWVIPDVSVQCSPSDVLDTIRDKALTDPEGTVYGIESAHAGIAIIDELRRSGEMVGREIYPYKPTKNKIIRAAGWISKAKAGRIYVVADSIPSQLMVKELLYSWTTFRGKDGDFDHWVDMMSIIDEMVSKTYGEEVEPELPRTIQEQVAGLLNARRQNNWKERKKRGGEVSIDSPTSTIPRDRKDRKRIDERDWDERKRESYERELADITERVKSKLGDGSTGEPAKPQRRSFLRRTG